MINTYLNKKFGLSDKVALIVGGGGAIGKAIALGLVKTGANVVISDYNVKAAKLESRSIEEATEKARGWPARPERRCR